jgi:hypothetical protein
VKGIPPQRRDERARAVYKFLATNIQDAQEGDARRVITGRAGSRQSAFFYLMRLLGIKTELALVKSRIAMPPVGKMSEVEIFDNLVGRIETESGPRWLTVRDKFAPFGYVPAELRGQPAIRLVQGTPRDTTPTLGAADGVLFEGKAFLKEDGSANVELVQSFQGRMGIGLRAVFERVPESQHKRLVETQLLASKLPGARLRELQIENRDDLAAPLVLRTKVEVPSLARVVGQKLLLKSIFPMSIAQIASLPERQTPLLLAASSHVELKFQVVVPSSMRLPPSLPAAEIRDGDRSVIVRDGVEGNAITLARVVDVPAGRVQPGAEYAKFVAFTQAADQALEREIAIATGH